MQAVLVDEERAFLRYSELPGVDPPLIWLHGVICSSTAELLPVAAAAPLEGRRSLLVDFLGYGYSDKPRHTTYSLELHARTVVLLLERLQLSRCHLIGHSLGGTVAALVAAQRPTLVASLVMAEANLDPGGGGISGPIAEQSEEEFVQRGLADLQERHRIAALQEPTGILARHLGMTAVLDARAVHQTAKALVRGTDPSVRELLKQLDMPRAYVNGDVSDQALPPQDDLVAAGVRWMTVEDSGHPMGLQNPNGFAQTVAQALPR